MPVATMFGDLSSVDFMQVFDGIKEVIPYLLPACLSFWAFRKGWSFVRSVIAGA